MVNQTPLADRIRPKNLESFVGQSHLVGKGKLIRTLIDNNELSSLLFWGPPGTGKTTLAHIISQKMDCAFVVLSAVNTGKAALRKAVEEARVLLSEKNQRTLLFVDEIHRWSKAQQDALLPYVEKGVVTLIGATTENPSFEIIRALLSRSRVCVLQALTTDDIVLVLRRALIDKDDGLGKWPVVIEDDVLIQLASLSGGDARQALNGLELAFQTCSKKNKKRIHIQSDDILQAMQRTHVVFDKRGEEFYNAISALHKSMRGSDADASLYWLARMLEGGADPLYIARRLVRFSSEDIGMANGEALIQANAAYDACHKIGMPECNVILAQAVVYCAKSKKSNALYIGYKKAAADARDTSHIGVPLHLRNAPTGLMKNLGYGKGYKYNPDFKGSVTQTYFPDELGQRVYFS